MTAWSMQIARETAVRESWALRYLPVAPPAGWERHAACVGLPTAMFFDDTPGPGRPVSRFVAELCEGCPARLHCLRAAAVEEMVHGDHVNGVRAGFSAAERRRMRRRVIRAVSAA